ncbi:MULTISPECIES: hypothetical protein [Rhizobium]|uniref:Uncharacterized protein n=1 Tax=Rhizobium binae TaxID=1138190 RepID=A0ABV2MSG9_9HYPH|nr:MULTISPECIES: hypothetical protein [Rhizobium]NKL52595.1 hypothetical protein [Rhizobium leguminosarum bv. viciae]MBX4938020.1 hypothetical protein [Rhizobium binae]MBX4944384.1 hypothetical protein [Rhizobium binae]MBX4980482.1 hypothetical protein [Rhizobium binae]MBX4995676.1 hypothetical protein [Rhizobium binae]
MPAQQEFDAAEFADRLAAMTDEEVFLMMQKLEEGSERIPPKDRDESDVFAQIAMVETAIEDRFPGQLLAPYKDWKQRRIGG